MGLGNEMSGRVESCEGWEGEDAGRLNLGSRDGRTEGEGAPSLIACFLSLLGWFEWSLLVIGL